MIQNNCAIKLPTEQNNIIKFKNYKNTLMMSFFIFADIESILHPVIDATFTKTANTYAYQQHEASDIIFTTV